VEPSSTTKISRYQELLDAIREAGFLGRSGQPRAGYRRLLAGARGGDQAIQAGEPWAGDLASRYRLALESYARRFQLRQAPRDEQRRPA
jgi:hypothetical protein